jgi:hypothetical protein
MSHFSTPWWKPRQRLAWRTAASEVTRRRHGAYGAI